MRIVHIAIGESDQLRTAAEMLTQTDNIRINHSAERVDACASVIDIELLLEWMIDHIAVQQLIGSADGKKACLRGNGSLIFISHHDTLFAAENQVEHTDVALAGFIHNEEIKLSGLWVGKE